MVLWMGPESSELVYIARTLTDSYIASFHLEVVTTGSYKNKDWIGAIDCCGGVGLGNIV